MQREDLYLHDMVSAADTIAEFIAGRIREDFENDAMRQSAVMYQLTIIGEAANHVTEGVRRRWPQVEWSKAVAARNIFVHAYFGIDWALVWDTVTIDVPLLRRQIVEILGAEFGGEGGEHA